MPVAHVFIKEVCLNDGVLTMRHWRGGWWTWRTSYWVEAEDAVVRSLLYHFTEQAFFVVVNKKGEDEIVPWAPTRSKIADLAEAIAAIVVLPAERGQPCWLDDRHTGTIVSAANGLLDLETRRLTPHTPQFFNQTAVPFDFAPDAPPPKYWLGFLNELWPDEPAAIELVAEWFGYVISGLLTFQKIFMMVGPTRGGKGAIARVLEALLGPKNVAGPTLSSLGETFGLEPLIGKALAVVADARFSGKNSETITERLLSISGQDTLTVPRKYKVGWTGQLPSRLHILSNELPRLGDASTAIVGRILLVLTKHSWLGREDHDLEGRFHRELPGILNWSLDALDRLTKNGGRFTRLPSADEAITLMRDLASPVAAFGREQCGVDPKLEIDTGDLYAAYKSWAEDNGHPKSSKQNFGRNLRAAFPAIRVTRPRTETRDAKEKRRRVYSGIALANKIEPDDEQPKATRAPETGNIFNDCPINGSTEDVLAHARAYRVNFVLGLDGAMFTPEFQGLFHPGLQDAIEMHYDAILDILRREAGLA